MLTVGDLIVFQDGNKFRESVLSFQDKWSTGMATAPGATTTTVTLAMVTATGVATATETVTETGMVTEKQTGKKVVIRHCGTGWKELPEQFVGIVTEILKEDHSDFDMFKIREQNGGYRYFRRFVLEKL